MDSPGLSVMRKVTGAAGQRDATGSGFGTRVRGLKVTADGLPGYIERVLRRYSAAERDGETFATWAARASDEDLS
jgi:sulfite reductase beta subunit-like hemoprotein